MREAQPREQRSQPPSGPVVIVCGTRPEIIKLAPIYFEARQRLGAARVVWVSTGQHLEIERDTLGGFGIRPDHCLEAGDPRGSLVTVDERIVRRLGRLQRTLAPALTIVQGDTISAFAAAWTAFHGRIPIAHVEAGLRTYDVEDPYPEDAYRRMIDVMASLHFAPTPLAAAHLKSEGIAGETIFVTGNTAVDALALLDGDGEPLGFVDLPALPPGCRLLFVSLHRRESWGEPLERMCHALRDIAERFHDVHIVLPTHLHPRVKAVVDRLLSRVPRITLLPPLPFATCHALLRQSHLILTDSGGIQEEAPSYGVPVVVLRRRTERPESLAQDLAVLTGTEREEIVRAVDRLLADPQLHERTRGRPNPFGDGRASERIVRAITRFLHGTRPLLTSGEQFAPAPARALPEL